MAPQVQCKMDPSLVQTGTLFKKKNKGKKLTLISDWLNFCVFCVLCVFNILYVVAVGWTLTVETHYDTVHVALDLWLYSV